MSQCRPETCARLRSCMGQRVRFVLLFLSASICSMYAHELGHAAAGWVQEIPVFPSPAKEYVLLTTIEWHERIWIAFGGPAVTAIVVSVAILWASRHRGQASCAILAGVLVEPAFYVIRTLLVGRGHDGLEWQGAQSAIGLDPNGHALDVLFVFLFFAGCAVLAVRDELQMRWRSFAKWFSLGLVGITALILIQAGNNAVFDRHFPKTQTLNIPPGLKAE
jgi:hypothetical protein